MANEILTAQAVCSAVDLYSALPAATSFRGLTGYGLIVDQKDIEIIAPVASSKGIWKPMYVSINGGEHRGRKTVNAVQIGAAVAQFEANSLLAVLRSTSGRGLRLDDAGMLKLVDASRVTTQINFEVTHYGGRSIVPLLNVKLGNLTIGEIEWHGGFSYNAPGDKPMRVGDELVLTRFLAKGDFASDAILARVWEDIARESNRLTLLHTDGRLPKSYEDRGNRMNVTLSQELTTLVQGVHLEKEQDFDYRVRGDKVVEVQMFLGKDDVRDEASFVAVLDAFRKECNRVYMLYCQPLNDRQKGLLGRPSSEVHGLVTTPQLEWQAQRDDRTKVIGFHPNAKNGNAVFPADRWSPARGKTHRVLSCRKGRGFTGYPAPAIYEERIGQKDQQTAVRQLVRIEFEGSEKVVVNGEEIKLAEKQQMQESNYWSDRLELMEDGNWWIVQTCTPHWQTLREVVTDDYNHHNVNGQYAKKIEWRTIVNEACPAERRFQPDRMWAEINGYQGGNPSTDDFARLDQSMALYGYKFRAHGIDAEGKDVEVSLKPVKNQYHVTWDEIPLNNQMGFLIKQNVEWPLCSCLMARRKADQDFCNFCTTHRNCQSCGKPTGFWGDTIAKAEAEGNKLCCPQCKKHQESVALIDAQIPLILRETISVEAQKLLAGEIIEGKEEAHKRIVEALHRRYRSDYERSSKLRDLHDCDCVIATNDGNWASVYTKAELERFATIHQQSEDELMLTVALLFDSSFRESYRRRPGQVVAHAGQYAYSALQGGRTPEFKLARFVAESEAFVQVIAQAVVDAESALADFRAKLTYLPDTDARVKKVAEAKSALENKDFAKAKELAAAAQQFIAEGLAMVAAGEIMPYLRIAVSTKSRTHTDVFAIAQDGQTISSMVEILRASGHDVYKDFPNSALIASHSHDNYGYQYNERWEVHCLPAHVSNAQKHTLRRVEQETRNYFTGPDTGWDLRKVGTVAFSTAYHRDFQGVEAQLDQEMRGNLPIDVTKWEQAVGDDGHVVVGPYRLERARHATDLVAAKKRAEQEAMRTVAEVPHTVHHDTSASLNPLAEAMRKAGLA